MKISMIAAMSTGRVIGKDNDLPWKLPADLKYFMNTTSGHHIIMGRKNYDSIGRPLPRRTNIIMSRQEKLKVPGCIVVHSLKEALALAEFNGEKEAFIIGGEQIYRLGLPLADRIYLTHVNIDIEGDTYFPEFDLADWKETSRKHYEADEKNAFDHDYVVYDRATR